MQSFSDLRAAQPPQRAIVLAALAACSALLGNYVDAPLTTVADTNLLPGAFFGLVLAAGLFVWSKRSVMDAIVVCVLTVAAWFIAVRITIQLVPPIEDFLTGSRPPAGPAQIGSSRYTNFTFALAGIAGGFAGSLLTWFGLAAVRNEFRDVKWLLALLCYGSVTGTLLEFLAEYKSGGLLIHFNSALPLLLVWQCGMAALVGYRLSRDLSPVPPQHLAQ